MRGDFDEDELDEAEDDACYAGEDLPCDCWRCDPDDDDDGWDDSEGWE